MSEYLERLKAKRPDVDWDAEMAAARERRQKMLERLDRSPWQRFRHWVHANAYPDLHREKCSKCRGTAGQ